MLRSDSNPDMARGSVGGEGQLPLSPLIVAIGALAVLAIAAGLVVAPLPTTLLLIVGGFGLMAFALFWERPELSLLALVFVTASILAPNSFNLRLPIAALDLRDIGFVTAFGVVGLQQLLRNRTQIRLPWWPVSLPIVVYLGIATFSLVYALLVERVQVNLALNEYRAVVFLSVFFITAWAIGGPKQLRTLLLGVLLLADVTALIVILQQFLGVENRLLAAMSQGWRVEATLDVRQGVGAVRIIPPGHVLLFVAMMVTFGFMIQSSQQPKHRRFYLAQFLFLNLGLLLTYTRSQWLATFIAMALVMMFIPNKDRLVLFGGLGGLAVLVALAIVMLPGATRNVLFQSAFVENVTTRFGSMFTPQETLQSYSLQWRIYENEQAFRSIAQHPFIGVGLGNEYRGTTLLQQSSMGTDPYFFRFIHNSYLYITVKMGFVGLFGYLIVAGAFLFHGFRSALKLRNESLRRLTLALVASYVGFISWCVTEPHLMYIEGNSTLGLMIGLVAVAQQLDQHEAQA